MGLPSGDESRMIESISNAAALESISRAESRLFPCTPSECQAIQYLMFFE